MKLMYESFLWGLGRIKMGGMSSQETVELPFRAVMAYQAGAGLRDWKKYLEDAVVGLAALLVLILSTVGIPVTAPLRAFMARRRARKDIEQYEKARG